MFKFEEGRRGSGYQKLSLWMIVGKKYGTDGWIIQYPIGSHIPVHIDPIQDSKHYRLNIVLKQAKSGGKFSGQTILNLFDRIIFFRPDIMPHSVSACSSVRYIFSIGFAIRG